jgi:hypothetical protein
MKAVCTLVALGGLLLAACGQSEPPKGAKGDPGPAGPPGPPGPAGPAGGTIRFAEFACQQAACTVACNDDERILNTYALNPAGTFVIETDSRASYRPRGQPSGKIVIACVPKTPP